MKNLILVSVMFFTIFLSSCGKEDSCNQDNLQAAVNKFSTAATAYLNDPTSNAKCKAYVDALKDYIDVVDNCPTVAQVQIDAAKANLAALTCK